VIRDLVIVGEFVKKLFFAAAAALMIAAPAFAHHSFAMYDQTVTKTLSGKLTRYVPGANHAQILFTVVDNDGNPVMKNGKPMQFGVETGSAIAMARNNVTVKTMLEGTYLTVRYFPLRDGRDFGALAGMLVTCGKTMPKGGCTPETGQRLIGDSFNAQ
jgi:Family of unknown function (DUF6152)